MYTSMFWYWGLDLSVCPTFLKCLHIVNNFQQWVLELSYCRMWTFFVTRSLYWYQDICTCGLNYFWNGFYRILLMVVFIFSYIFLKDSLLSLALTISVFSLSLSLSLSLSAYKHRYFCFTHRYVKSMGREYVSGDFIRLKVNE